MQAIVEADLAAAHAGATLTVVVAPDQRLATHVLAITDLDQVLTLTSSDASA